MDSYKLLFTNNLIAFLAIFLASVAMKYLSGFDAEIGSYLYLPIGAKILVFLLFGRQVLPGVMASCIFCGVILLARGAVILFGALLVLLWVR